MLAILVLALGLMVCSAKVSEAAPMGTAFTYQGRLMDANGPAEGQYDFEFKLWMDPCEIVYPPPVGDTLTMNDLDVIDGYFTVELDFNSPSAFDGYARWLEISVRPGVENDPCTYEVLLPRQEVTPAPYALQTRGIFVDDAGNVGIGTTNPLLKLHIAEAGMASLIVHETTNNVAGQLMADTGYVSLSSAFSHPLRFMVNDIMRVIIEPSGNVGIGITNPGAKLEVAGQVKITGGSPGDGRVLTSDADGLGNWQSPAVDGDSDSSNELNTSLVLNGNILELTDNGGTLTTSLSALVNDGDWTIAGSDMYLDAGVTGNVGIGTTNPLSKLSVGGDGFANTGVYGTGNTYGVYGSSTNYGVYGFGDIGVVGQGSTWGVHGVDTDTSSYGRLGYDTHGVYGSGSTYGVYGLTSNPSGYAGYFSGGQNYFQGNVGIGTSSPGYKLEVVDDQPDGVITRFENTSGVPTAGGIAIEIGTNSDPGGANHYIEFYGGKYDALIGYVNGNTAGGVSYISVSDARLKTNITDFAGGLDMVSRMKVREYEFIEAPGKERIGFIAQELQTVFPHAVSGDPEGDVKENPMGVDYGRVTPVLVSAIQELIAENESLKQRLEAQEKTLQQLQTLITKGAVQ